ncbi:MAG: YfhO family protein [Acidobacteriia bacterium]|nr:YfhO family protein [Terriglobia bacterium]
MKPGFRLVLAGLPGLVVVLAALFGWVPTGQDLPSYFVPLRYRTAEVLAGWRGPFWNPDVGCGEPFFANPQTGLLYPPVWLAAVLPTAVAVGVEAGLHLAILAVGCAFLARRLGVGGWLDLVAGWTAAAAGPVLCSVGVLNNLDALAWMPWVWWAALGGSLSATAGFLALSYLAAEPQLAVIAGVVAVTIAPRRRTLAALVLAVGIVAVQAVPFAAWVRGGDRGPRAASEIGMARVVMPRELPAMAVPGAPLPQRTGARFVEHLTVPLWALVLGAVAVLDRRRPVRHLAWWGWFLIALSVLPSFPLGLKVWNFATVGLVRYSGRLLFPAVVALVPAGAAAIGSRRPRVWVGIALAVTAGLSGLALGGSPTATLLGAVAAGAALVTPLAAPAALVGTLAVAWHVPEILSLQKRDGSERTMCLDAQRQAARIYPVGPSLQQLAWVQEERQPRLRSLCLGYTAVLDGRRSARTFGPLVSRLLDAHLREADRGPAGRWWLNALGADRIVSHHPIPGFAEVCRDGDLVVYDNPEAWPEVSVACTLPQPGQALQRCGLVHPLLTATDRHRWSVTTREHGGVFLWLETPDPGWELRLDDVPVREVNGAGILHGVEVPPGEHEVTARYRPPGLVAGAVVSLVSLGLLVGAAWRRW